jgi:hypothetical protein
VALFDDDVARAFRVAVFWLSFPLGMARLIRRVNSTAGSDRLVIGSIQKIIDHMVLSSQLTEWW